MPNMGIMTSEVPAVIDDVKDQIARILPIRTSLAQASTGPRIKTQLQGIFDFKSGSVPHQLIHEIVLNHGLRAERISPGSLNAMLEIMVLKTDPIQPKFGLHASEHELHDIIEINSDPFTSAVCKEAVRLAGLRGKIIVEKSASGVNSVELVSGYTFDLRPLFSIDCSLLLPRVACIDGLIESVSEIHHLLESAAETKEPCAIFVRGAAEDVKQTLKINYDRGHLRVVLCAVPFDLEGMNTLNDIATIAGCDLVSSLKGDLISSIRINELPVVDRIDVAPSRISLVSRSTRKQVFAHVNTLRARRDEESVDDLGALLDKRIRTLTPNHVVVRLVDDMNFVQKAQAIDTVLRTIRSTVQHGVHEGSLAATHAAATFHAAACLKTLAALGAIIS
jgi:chaperonin GroEL (HSP60 family)